MSRTSSLEAPGTGMSPPVLDEEFVGRWLECLSGISGYAAEFPFAEVRSLLGRKIRICVPLLAYTQFSEASALRAYTPFQGEAIQIRFLAPPPPQFTPGAPTQSLLPLARWQDVDTFWHQAVSGNIRKKVRKCEKDRLCVSRGTSRPLLDTFYALFLETMHRHGTPPFPREIFQSILAGFDAEVITVTRTHDPVAAYFIIYAGRIALFQWAGLKPNPGYATILGEWAAIQGAMERRCHWFDLGRASFGGAPFRHKALWRPSLFSPSVVPTPHHSVYEKYRLAAAGWRRLPAPLASRLGPKLTPHLADL